MKLEFLRVFLSLIFALITTSTCATLSEANPAGYYRVWQGFKKQQMASDQFLREMPSFMRATVDLYDEKDALRQYFVVIPPSDKPDYIPDELALVGLTSESDYHRVRSTPEGKRYADSHWDVFDKETSGSAKKFVHYFDERPSALDSAAAYNLLSKRIDWKSGYSLVFIGTRKNDVSPDEFSQKLQRHIELAAKNLGPLGMDGYIIIPNKNYEVAYLHWDSKDSHDRAIESDAGKQVFNDAGRFMDTLMYEPSTDHIAGESIDHGRFYKEHRARKRALLVVTSHEDLGKTGKKTGYYFPEVAHPYYELSKEGIQIDIASPKGGNAPMDPSSLDLNDPINKILRADKNFMGKLGQTIALNDVDSTRYSAIVFAGGHGTMWDFKDSEAIQHLTADIYDHGGVVAAVCHGPAALVDVKLKDGGYLIAGKNVTGFTNEEESAMRLTEVVPFLLEDAMRLRGAKFQEADLWLKNVIVDLRLVTGQNPASASGVGAAVAELLK